jgi:hypothetical protein
MLVAMRMKPAEASLIAGVYRPGYDWMNHQAHSL